MFKTSAFLLLLVMSTICHAQQKVPVQDGMEVSLTVSQQVLNRIAVENDRILTVKGISGQFELDKDAELGQVFLKPIQSDEQDLIHLFLVTEKGYTYPLSLIVKEGSAQSILLTPLDNKVAQWEQSNSYETLLKVLVCAMVNQKDLEGFVNESPANIKTLFPKIKDLKMTRLQSYKGHQLRGEVLEISNKGKEILFLVEEDFYQSGTRAVAIINPELLPGAKTYVYRVLG